MKRNPNFVLRQIADEHILVPISGTLDFNGIITLNTLGLEIYRRIDEVGSEAELIAALCLEYNAPEDVIAADTREFLTLLRNEHLILEEDDKDTFAVEQDVD